MNTWQADVAAGYRKDDFAKLYLETLGASALRIELWGALVPVVRERWQDITWHDFSFEGGGERGVVTTEVSKTLHAASRGALRVIATTWSPPPWMKVNGSLGNGHPKRKNYSLNIDHPIEGGNWTKPLPGEEGAERFRYIATNKLRHDRYLHFAKLLVEWTRYFQSLGVTLYALSPTNEPRFSHWFSSCVFNPDEYAELVETVAWMFKNQGEPSMRIFGPEHMTWDISGNRRYLEALRERPPALQNLTAIASHGYLDGYTTDLRRASPGAFGKFAAPYNKKIWVTEGGFGDHEWPAPLHQLGASFLYALRDGGVSLLTTWQTLTSDPPDEHGLMGLKGPTKKTYAAMQFWRFIRPGMVRIGVDVTGTLDAVAFEDVKLEKTVIVLLNRTRNVSTVSLHLTGKRLAALESVYLTDASHDCTAVSGWRDTNALTLPAESIATLVLKTAPAE